MKTEYFATEEHYEYKKITADDGMMLNSTSCPGTGGKSIEFRTGSDSSASYEEIPEFDFKILQLLYNANNYINNTAENIKERFVTQYPEQEEIISSTINSVAEDIIIVFKSNIIELLSPIIEEIR